jgi:hypothetical protein
MVERCTLEGYYSYWMNYHLLNFPHKTVEGTRILHILIYT